MGKLQCAVRRGREEVRERESGGEACARDVEGCASGRGWDAAHLPRF